ncbi:hypothetical protein PM10SUCC1_30330 [Propionigenium maris DSM 9537]|uniref:Potassium channel domain-containing protein n=1 Tax=Propionigenium maris DSM 9537 TaxID=1123000 RepID=A0A9W6GLX9_9FUSO|nr:potassium channel family protein [Propionigenium maris]GLI57519.1 hypothetical protein PM10SUCC1_30330 [Propionigenium maris DSM 9537]
MFRRLRKVINSYGALRSRKVLALAFILSLLLALLAEINNPNGEYIGDIEGVLFNYFPMIFMNIAPVLFVFRIGFLRKIRQNPLYAIYMILYFLLFVPLFMGIQSKGGRVEIDRSSFFYIGVTGLNLLAIAIGHIVLIRYVFLDVIFKRRKPTGRDTIIVFMTYVSMGVSFGFVYALITTLSPEPAFSNMSLEMAEDLGGVKLYFRHIYYSFITLTSVGFGDIYPESWVAQTVAVIESILGVFLLSFSLGIILSSETEEHSVKQDENDKFRKELMEDIEKFHTRQNEMKNLKEELLADIEELIDKKLGNRIDKG